MEPKALSQQTLESWMQHPSYIARTVAMMVIAKAEPSGDYDDLITKGLEDPVSTVQAAALKAAAHHMKPGEEYYELALFGLRNNDYIVREAASELLMLPVLRPIPAHIISPPRPVFTIAMCDEDPDVAENGLIGAVQANLVSVSDLKDCLRGHGRWGNITPEAAVKASERFAPIRRQAEKWMEDATPAVREAALVSLLGAQSERAVTMAYNAAAHDDDPNVRYTAIRVLGHQQFDDYEKLLDVLDKHYEGISAYVLHHVYGAMGNRLHQLRQGSAELIPGIAGKLEQYLRAGTVTHLDVCYKALAKCGFNLPPVRNFDPGDRTFYKYCLGGILVAATIPADAHIIGTADDFRASKVRVTVVTGDFAGKPVGVDPDTWEALYFPGQTVECDDFSLDGPEILSSGLRFFGSIEQAKAQNVPAALPVV